MVAAQRTYSFDAPAALADRLTHARVALGTLVSEAPDLEAWTAREVEMGLARLRRDVPSVAGDSEAFMRAAVELLVSVVEKVSAGLDVEGDLRAFEREDAEGDAFRRGALRASAPVWHER
jgi:hypothetical protein